jgi:hypothetical protein
MSQIIQIPNICEFMNRHLVDVFETMLSMKAVPAPAGTPEPPAESRVTGSVAFAGERINGAVYLHLAAPFAGQVAAAMLGLSVEDLGEAEVNDVVGEATNMRFRRRMRREHPRHHSRFGLRDRSRARCRPGSFDLRLRAKPHCG